jgi:activator of HSP90 ATPase
MIREKYPLKGEGELKGMIEDIVTDKASMDSMQWYKIIERMYDSQDIKILEEKIKENAKSRLRSEISKKLNKKALSP